MCINWLCPDVPLCSITQGAAPTTPAPAPQADVAQPGERGWLDRFHTTIVNDCMLYGVSSHSSSMASSTAG